MKAFVIKEIGAVGMIGKPIPTPGANDFVGLRPGGWLRTF